MSTRFMRHKFRWASLKKPKVNWEKDETTGGARPVVTIAFEVADMPAEVVRELASYAVNNHPVSVILASSQGSMHLVTNVVSIPGPAEVYARP